MRRAPGPSPAIVPATDLTGWRRKYAVLGGSVVAMDTIGIKSVPGAGPAGGALDVNVRVAVASTGTERDATGLDLIGGAARDWFAVIKLVDGIPGYVHGMRVRTIVVIESAPALTSAGDQVAVYLPRAAGGDGRAVIGLVHRPVASTGRAVQTYDGTASQVTALTAGSKAVIGVDTCHSGSRVYMGDTWVDMATSWAGLTPEPSPLRTFNVEKLSATGTATGFAQATDEIGLRVTTALTVTLRVLAWEGWAEDE